MAGKCSGFKHSFAHFIGLAAGVMLPLTVMAGPLGYNYVEVDYYNVEIDGAPVNDEGFALGGSVLFTDNFFFTARYADSDDLQRISAGLGAQAPLSKRSSLYGVLSYEDIDIDRVNRDENGFAIEGGLRHALASNFEVSGGLQYLNIDNVKVFDDEFGYKLGAVYSFTPGIAVKAGYNIVDDYEEFTVGARLSF